MHCGTLPSPGKKTHLQTFLTLKIHASENSTVTKSAKKSFSRHRQGIKNKPRQEDVSSVAAPEALSECRGTARTGERWHSQGRAGTKGEWKGQSHFMDAWAPLRLRAFPRTRPSLSMLLCAKPTTSGFAKTNINAYKTNITHKRKASPKNSLKTVEISRAKHEAASDQGSCRSRPGPPLPPLTVSLPAAPPRSGCCCCCFTSKAVPTGHQLVLTARPPCPAARPRSARPSAAGSARRQPPSMAERSTARGSGTSPARPRPPHAPLGRDLRASAPRGGAAAGGGARRSSGSHGLSALRAPLLRALSAPWACPASRRAPLPRALSAPPACPASRVTSARPGRTGASAGWYLSYTLSSKT